MTLIEVLAGLVVLGTVLASVSIARGRFMQQTARARQRLEAARHVDEMLSRWLSGPADAIPVPSRGALEGESKLVWWTSFRPDRSAENLGARVVRLEVLDNRLRADAVLSVEFVIRDPRQKGSPATQPASDKP